MRDSPSRCYAGYHTYLSLAEETAGGASEDGGGGVGVELRGGPGLFLSLLSLGGRRVRRAHGEGHTGARRHGHRAGVDGLAGEGRFASARDVHSGGDARGGCGNTGSRATQSLQETNPSQKQKRAILRRVLDADRLESFRAILYGERLGWHKTHFREIETNHESTSKSSSR